jgi:hypothetical protein
MTLSNTRRKLALVTKQGNRRRSHREILGFFLHRQKLYMFPLFVQIYAFQPKCHEILSFLSVIKVF